VIFNQFFYNILGWIGLGLLLVGFYIDATNKVAEDSKIYFLLNLLGSVSLAVHSYFIGSTPILILNVVWAGISLSKLLKKH